MFRLWRSFKIEEATHTFGTDNICTVCKYEKTEQGGTEEKPFEKLTKVDQLKAGMKLVLAGVIGDIIYVAGDIEGTNTYMTAASENSKELTTLPGTAVVLTLGGETGAWTLAANGKYLTALASQKLARKEAVEDGSKWSISFDDAKNAIIQSNLYSTDAIYFNVSASPKRFKTYKSTSNSVVVIQLYGQIVETEA